MESTTSHTSLSPFEKLRQLADQVRPGMTRNEVEQIFKHSNGGIQGQYITIYNETRHGRVEVYFDRTGGTGSPENRVSSPAKVYMTVSQ